jgi:hypothetical protein
MYLSVPAPQLSVPVLLYESYNNLKGELYGKETFK